MVTVAGMLVRSFADDQGFKNAMEMGAFTRCHPGTGHMGDACHGKNPCMRVKGVLIIPTASDMANERLRAHFSTVSAFLFSP